MIAFFPQIYEDELIYSCISRYHMRSGYSQLVSTIDDIYLYRTVHPDFEFVNTYTEDALAWLTKEIPLKELIMKHTMFPAYARFLPVERKLSAFNSLCTMTGNWNNLMAIPKTGVRHFRFCPLCVEEDRSIYGETYWHRTHQIQRTDVCPKHKCCLTDTNIKISGKATPGLYDAENIIPIHNDTIYISDERKIELTQYIIDVMNQPIDFENSFSVGSFLCDRLNKEYYNKSGLMKKITKLYTDYTDFYQGLPTMEQFHLQKIFNNRYYDNYYICQLAFFEGISVDDLDNISLLENDGFMTLYRELADKYNVNLDTIINIGKDILSFNAQRNIQRPSGIRAKKWDEIDNELLPLVTETVDEIYKTDYRPVKLSYTYITKKLNLPQKQIYQLPKCKSYIKNHLETQEEFWAREVVWAVKELQKSDQNVNWTAIRKLTNIRRQDLVLCIPYIKDDDVRMIVDNILNDNY